MRYALLALLLLTGAAQARDPDGRYANSPYKAWYESQHNSNGEWCCTDADGHQFYGQYKINVDGSVTIRDGGKTFKIEKYKILTGSNPTGSAVWWYIDTDLGRKTYCFSPGSLS